MLKLLVGLAGVFGVNGYSSGARDCQTVNHGTFKSPIPSDWTLSLLDSTGTSVTQWSSGQTYTAQISATSTNFKGWSWAPLKGTPASFPAGSASMAGSFSAGDSYSHANTGCAGSITQTNGGTSRSVIKAIWTPPAAGTGTVSLWSMMVISKNGNNYNAVLTVPESASATTSTDTSTVTGSKGASTSASSTTVPSPSVKNTPSPLGVMVLPSSAPQQVVVQQSSSLNVAAIVVGGVVAGAVMLAVVGPTVHHFLKGRRRPISPMTQFNLPPPQVVSVNPLGSSPAYSAHAT